MDITALLKTCSVILSQPLVGGIIAVESNGNPYAINVNLAQGGAQSYSFDNETDAISQSITFIKDGNTVDLGLGQINSDNLKALNLTLKDTFDPCKNLTALQTVFLWGYNRKSDKDLSQEEKEIAAISRYNTGSPIKGIENGYVFKVLAKKLLSENKDQIIAVISRKTNQSDQIEVTGNDDYDSVPDGYNKYRYIE